MLIIITGSVDQINSEGVNRTTKSTLLPGNTCFRLVDINNTWFWLVEIILSLQGYHDVAITFLLVVGEHVGYKIMERLSVTHLKQFMTSNMEKTMSLLQVNIDQWEHSIAVYISVSADVSHHQKVQLRSSQTSPRSGSWNNICSALADHVVWSRASCLLWCCQTLRLLHRWSSSDACVPSCCYCSAQRTGNIGHRWSSQIFSSAILTNIFWFRVWDVCCPRVTVHYSSRSPIWKIVDRVSESIREVSTLHYSKR